MALQDGDIIKMKVGALDITALAVKQGREKKVNMVQVVEPVEHYGVMLFPLKTLFHLMPYRR